METKLNEIWKDIPGYEGNYQASTLGRIRSHSRIGRNSGRVYPSKIIAGGKNPQGYRIMNLCKDGKIKYFTLHRLIAITFIPNPHSFSEINHINGIKHDNGIDNLEWCTSSHNKHHAFRTGLRVTPKGGDNHMSKMVLNIETGIYYGSVIEAHQSTGVKNNYSNFVRKVKTNKTKFRYI